MNLLDDSALCNKIIDSSDELCFKYKELSSLLAEHNHEEDTNSYYETFTKNIREGKGFSDAEKKIISQFIYDKQHCNGYEHMDADKFSELLRELFKEFDYTQLSFAKEKEIKVSQSTINRILGSENKKPINTPTQLQYDILSFFLKKCQRENNSVSFDPANVYDKHFNCAKRLYRILNGDLRIFNMYDSAQREYTYSNRNILSVLIEDYLITLPIESQNLILEHPIAFFDTLLTCEWLDDWVIYNNQIEFFGFYKALPEDKKESFQYDFEKMCFEYGMLTYCDDYMFDLITQKRSMIIKARESGITDPPGIIKYDSFTWFKRPITGKDKTVEFKKNEPDLDKQRERFEQTLLDFIKFDIREYPIDAGNELLDSIIDGIDYRLNMSPFEWHLDMLNSLCRMNNLGDEVFRLISITKETL